MDMLVKNARFPDSDSLMDIEVTGGRFGRIAPNQTAIGPNVIDAGGNLVIPPFLDPHLHLDAVLTAGKPIYNVSGSHPEGIMVWGKYKEAYPGFEDLKARVRRAVEWEVSLGTLHIRTHIDICDPNLTALKIMLDLRESLAGIADIQIVAFPQDGILAFPRCRELMEEAVRMGADLVGGIPHGEWTREDGVESIEFIFDLAEKYGKNIDIHCDETDDPHSRFLETVAAQTIRRGYQGKVSAGHTTAMHSYNGSYAFKIQELVRKAEVNIIANPFDNVVLMGRFDDYPKRRGITRVRELLDAGVNVSLGHDSIMDPWYPLGKGDMLEAALLAVHLCHMSGMDGIRRVFDTITVNSARTMGVADEYGIVEGRAADFVVLDCLSVFDAVRLSPARLFAVKNGNVVARNRPADREVFYPKTPDSPVSIDFRSAFAGRKLSAV